ncbi:MAG: FtsH protease activity modulator HflK [Firmicutes bacterium]|nr:FtsH protease activity modulator HflK [Bacillota bacterium]
MFNGKNPSADAKAIRTGVGIGALVIVVLIIVFNCFYKVGEQEQAVVTTFGRVQGVKTAGLYFKLPFIQQVHKVDTTTRGMQIGYVENDRTPLNGYQVPEEATMITSDFNFVNIDFYLEYKVSDPQKFLYAASEPEAVLKNLAQSCIRSTVINYPVDEVITTGKGQIQAEVREMLTQELQRAGIGIELVNISVQDAEPPTETIMQAFKAVETAKQEADTAVNTALKYQNEQIPNAKATADRIVQEAEAVKAARIAEAEGQVNRFNTIFEQYKLNPLITKQRLFYETLENVLPNLKVIITDGTTETTLPLDSYVNTEE